MGLKLKYNKYFYIYKDSFDYQKYQRLTQKYNMYKLPEDNEKISSINLATDLQSIGII